MSISIIRPTAPGPIGPGYYVQIANTVGPVQIDDYVLISVTDTVTGEQCCGMSAVSHGSLFPFELMGVRNTPADETPLGPYDPPRRLGGKYSPTLAGGAVTVDVWWYHHTGGVMAEVHSTGWTYDPVGGLGELMWRLSAADAGGSAILDAVRILKTKPGQE